MRIKRTYWSLPTDPDALRVISNVRTSFRAVGIRVSRLQIWQTLLARAKDEIKGERSGQR